MSYEDSGAPRHEGGLAPIESVLARYPGISDEELRALKSWFMREASALDVGMLASNERIAPQYAQFRADHLDRLGTRDAMNALAWIIAAAVVIAGVVLVAMK
ncbi:hypothetical protein GCM10011515_19770 [Tsuneonella deserti]|uniref:Uncharacterized protein n=1 Tax=Tsuneonella deserti TaxID=2035528 RepID=A0ABQ1S9A0_9SPHN|nr:hypothetical protein [Tsuneonella deserti]GGE00022.1 hypothetical protein GCM10011515_19770 [Tsuneonella deserti]